MTNSHVWHDQFTCVTWPIHMCDIPIHIPRILRGCVSNMTHLYVWHDSPIWDMTHSELVYEQFTFGTWLLGMWDMTHSYVRRDSFTCVWVTWLIHMWDIIYSYGGTWLNSYVWHVSFICVCHYVFMYVCVLIHSYECDMIHVMCVWDESFTSVWVMTHTHTHINM